MMTRYNSDQSVFGMTQALAHPEGIYFTKNACQMLGKSLKEYDIRGTWKPDVATSLPNAALTFVSEKGHRLIETISNYYLVVQKSPSYNTIVNIAETNAHGIADQYSNDSDEDNATPTTPERGAITHKGAQTPTTPERGAITPERGAITHKGAQTPTTPERGAITHKGAQTPTITRKGSTNRKPNHTGKPKASKKSPYSRITSPAWMATKNRNRTASPTTTCIKGNWMFHDQPNYLPSKEWWVNQGDKWAALLNSAAMQAGVQTSVQSLNMGSLTIRLIKKNAKGQGVTYNMYEKEGKHPDGPSHPGSHDGPSHPGSPRDQQYTRPNRNVGHARNGH